MTVKIICKSDRTKTHSFYVIHKHHEYYLFSQDMNRSIWMFFKKGTPLNRAIDYSYADENTKLIKTMEKIRLCLKYIEREEGISIFNKTKRKYQGRRAIACA